MLRIDSIPICFWLLLAIPIVGSAVAYRRATHKPFGLVMALLVPPLVGELVFVYASLKGSAQVSRFAEASLWRAVFYLYPFVLIPLGLWSPFVGLIAWVVLERRVPANPRKMLRYLPLAAAMGAIVGAGLLGGFYGSLRALNLSDAIPVLWALIGAVSGMTGGVIVAFFLWIESCHRFTARAEIRNAD